VAAQADGPGVLLNAMENRSGTKTAQPRSLIRRFIAETAFSFIEWRQQRLMRALELLASEYASDDRRARSRVRDR
jgi:hypothetical protein